MTQPRHRHVRQEGPVLAREPQRRGLLLEKPGHPRKGTGGVGHGDGQHARFALVWKKPPPLEPKAGPRGDGAGGLLEGCHKAVPQAGSEAGIRRPEELQGQVEAPGGMDVREINHAFNVALPQLEHRSLNGFILEELGYVPKAGETFEYPGVRIEIMEASDTQVIRARLAKLSPSGREESA